MVTDIFSHLNSGAWLHGGASDLPEIAELLSKCADACFELNATPPSMRTLRTTLLQKMLGTMGNNITIHSPFRCDFGFNIHIGNNFIGNFNLSILDEAQVHIGNNVMIGPNCSLITINHAILPNQRNEGIMAARPITIEDDVWIAANVVVLPGVSIGRGSVIGAGSVVTHSIPEGVVAVGNPCRVIRHISSEDMVKPVF